MGKQNDPEHTAPVFRIFGSFRGMNPFVAAGKSNTFVPMKHLAPLFAVAALATSHAAELSSIPFKTIAGKDTSLADYKGKVVLVVNTASKCGLTPQYEALEGLQKKYAEKGFTVIGFPCNDFGSQEPGTAEEIQTFCKTTYSVSFPLMEKIHVKGSEQHPLYAALTGKDGVFPGDVKWNFGKFLIGKDGKAIARFEPKQTPDSKEVTEAIEKALKP
jgi:glutathione peroxidase